jgi:hypothetical protein
VSLAIATHSTTPSADEIIADPLFKKGYEHFWAGEEPTTDRMWLPPEQEAYERGRDFAAFCQESGEGKVALVRGYLAAPRAITLLCYARHVGKVA